MTTNQEPAGIDAPPPIPDFFAAMLVGAPAADRLLALFADDAEYVEPFTGTARAHRGKDAIRAAFADAWQRPLPDQRIVVDRVDVGEDGVVAHWTCFSPALPGGRGAGVNLFQLATGSDGARRIARLETRFA